MTFIPNERLSWFKQLNGSVQFPMAAGSMTSATQREGAGYRFLADHPSPKGQGKFLLILLRTIPSYAARCKEAAVSALVHRSSSRGEYI